MAMAAVEAGTKVIRPEPGSCAFYVQRKKRFCKMSVKPGAQYCGEHSPIPATEHDLGNKPISELRVPCPYDPKHTCFASKMEKHLKICNSKPPSLLPPYLVPGVNLGDPSPDAGGKQEKLSVGNVSDEKLINIIGQLMATYKKCVEGQIEMEPLEHTVLEDELSKPEYGPSVLKHLIQNSSLLGQLDKTGLLENGNTFVEFGSASHRHKFDKQAQRGRRPGVGAAQS